MDLKETVKLAQENNEEAIKTLIDSIAQKAKYIAMDYTKKDPHKADDIVQESYIRAFSNLSQLENPERFEPWFFTILNNIAKNKTKGKKLDQLSSQFSDLDYDDRSFEEFVEDEKATFNPKKDFDYSELKKGMQEVLDSLPEMQKQSVYMYYYENLNAREIAEFFSTTEDTIRSRLRYAKNKMKERINSMERQGVSLMGVSPIPFLLWMLQTETENTIPTKFTISTLSKATAATKVMSTAKTKKTIQLFEKTVAKKALVTTAVAGSIVAGVTTYQLNPGILNDMYKFTLTENKKNQLKEELQHLKKREKIIHYYLEKMDTYYQPENQYHIEEVNEVENDFNFLIVLNPQIKGDQLTDVTDLDGSSADSEKSYSSINYSPDWSNLTIPEKEKLTENLKQIPPSTYDNTKKIFQSRLHEINIEKSKINELLE